MTKYAYIPNYQAKSTDEPIESSNVERVGFTRVVLEDSRPSSHEYKGHGVALFEGHRMEHKSGRIYEIRGFSNTSVDETPKFPHLVLYQNVDDFTMWARPIRDIRDRFRLMDANHQIPYL